MREVTASIEDSFDRLTEEGPDLQAEKIVYRELPHGVTLPGDLPHGFKG